MSNSFLYRLSLIFTPSISNVMFILRTFLTLVSIIWICFFFYNHRLEIILALKAINTTDVLVAMAVILLGLVPGAWAWQRLITEVLPSVGTTHGILVYLRSSIGKYTPGGALTFVIQHKILASYGAKPTLLLQVFLANAFAACLAAAFLALPASHLLIGEAISFWWYLCPTVIMAIVLLVSYWLNYWPCVGKLLLYFRVPSPRLFSETVLLMVGAWALTGSHLLVLSSDDVSSIFLISAYAFSAIAGILFAVLPGAFGVRDGVLLAILSTQLPPENAVIISLISRVLIIFGDVSGTIISATILKWLTLKNQKRSFHE